MAERKTLEVNGEVYVVLMNDTEVIQAAAAVEKKLRNLASLTEKSEHNVDAALEILNFLTQSTDNMLGEGALMKITGGQTPSIAAAIELYRLLSGAVVEIYEQDLANIYE